MKRLSLVLLVLVLATSLFFSCDQKEEKTGTGVSVASPSNLPSYSGEIPSSDSYIISTISGIVDEISTEIEDISDYYGYYSDGAWVSQYDENVSSYYGGSMRVVGNEREVESQSGSQGGYSYTADVSVDLSDYGCSSGTATISGLSGVGERESASVNTDSGAYSMSVLYEFGFSVSMSGECAGKYILFISANGSETGTVYDESDFWYALETIPVSASGYIKIYDNDDALVREVALTETDMMMLYPE